jgi:hypothetical protein
MKVHELMLLLGAMDSDAEVFVALFKADGILEMFDVEDVIENNGNAQIEIAEEDPAA